MEFLATNLKADKFTFPVLELFRDDIDLISSEVGAKVDQAPVFFRNAPVVVDLKGLDADAEVEFAVLVGVLRSHGLNPVAIRGGNRHHAESAVRMELAVLADERRGSARRSAEPGPTDEPEHSDRDDDGDESAVDAAAPAAARQGSRTHLRPVRSGQKLAAPGGDLVVVASTSAGSELIAAGNIHVYGALRGRALAGVTGDESCRIFCQNLQAELVSVAGHYRVSEDIDESLRGRPVQIYLDADRLLIAPVGA